MEVLEVIEVTKCNVLIVEDNDIIGRVMSTIFKKAGCNVDLAVNGEEALNYFYHNTYNFILMDIGLPDYNGLYIAKLIRTFYEEQKAKTPIAIITAHSEISEYVIEAKELNIEDFIIKPCTISTCYMLLKKYAFVSSKLMSKRLEHFYLRND